MAILTGVVNGGQDDLISSVVIGVSTGQRLALDEEKRTIPANIQIRGLWDTGADAVVLDSHFVNKLGLDQRGLTSARTADQIRYTASYPLNIIIDFENGERLIVENARCIAADELRSKLGCDALIGRPVLDRIIFQYHGPLQSFSISDEWPN